MFLAAVLPIGTSILQILLMSSYSLERLQTYETFLTVSIYVSVAARIATIAWRYVVGVKLWEKLSSDASGLKFFRVCIAFFVLTLILGQIRSFLSMRFGWDVQYWIYNVIWILSLVAWLYCCWFIARLLVSVEQGRLTPFRMYVGDFISMIFLPIGIWWIQPRINRVFSGDLANLNPDAPLDHNLTEQPQS